MVAMKLRMSIPFYYFGELQRVFEAQKELNRFGWARMQRSVDCTRHKKSG